MQIYFGVVLCLFVCCCFTLQAMFAWSASLDRFEIFEERKIMKCCHLLGSGC